MASAFVVSFCAAAQAESLDTIPMPSGGFGSATAISGDGSTVIGNYINSANDVAGFYWSGSGVAVDIGFLAAPFRGTTAAGVSTDGSVIVGTSASHAFRWTQAGGIVAIPFLAGGFFSAAYGVSGDGSIVVGQSDAPGFPFSGGEAFYWTAATGSVALGTLDTFHNAGPFSAATAISSDGQVIVGYATSNTQPGTGEAFRWTQSGGMVGLGTLNGTGAGTFSQANAVNADGTVIVGQSSTSGAWAEAFRWTSATHTMQGLGFLRGTDAESNALAVSADGNTVVGYSGNDFSDYAAFRWTSSTHMQSIQSLLASAGVNLTNWSLQKATGVSADGKVVVGFGTDSNGVQQTWIARFATGNSTSGGGNNTSGGDDSSPTGTGIITLSGIAESFAGFSTLGQSGTGQLDSLLGTQTDIANNHACGACGFVYGTGGSVPGDPFGAGALGAKIDVAPDTAVGFSAGAQAGRSSLVFDGSMDMRGGLASAFVAYLPETGPQLSAAVTGLRFSADITRGYLNGNTPVSSSGSTDGYGYGGVLRAGWAFEPSAAWRITPFASYSAARVHFDGWTETTGVFPAQFDAIDQTARIMRLGGDVRWSFAPQTWTWAQVNWAHHFDDTATDITGHLIGLFTLTVPGSPIDQDYVETTVGVRAPLSPTAAISASATAVVSQNTPASFLGRLIVSQLF